MMGDDSNLLYDMYNNNEKREKTNNNNRHEIDVSLSSRDSYIIDVKNQKIHVPTMQAYNKLHEECDKLSTAVKQLTVENKKHVSAIRQLLKHIKNLEEELSRKVDKYD